MPDNTPPPADTPMPAPAHPPRRRPPPTPSINQVVWNQDDSLLLVAVSDGSIRVWGASSGEVVHLLKEHQQMVRRTRSWMDGWMDGWLHTWLCSASACASVGAWGLLAAVAVARSVLSGCADVHSTNTPIQEVSACRLPLPASLLHAALCTAS